VGLTDHELVTRLQLKSRYAHHGVGGSGHDDLCDTYRIDPHRHVRTSSETGAYRQLTRCALVAKQVRTSNEPGAYQ